MDESGIQSHNDNREIAPNSQFGVELDILIHKQVYLQTNKQTNNINTCTYKRVQFLQFRVN